VVVAGSFAGFGVFGLAVVAERLDAQGSERLRKALCDGDPCDEVADCWTAKEKIRSVFQTDHPDQVSDLLDDAIEYCAAPEAAPELHKPARTLRKCTTEINTSTSTGSHNGRTEAANAKTKDIKRTGRGFRNAASISRRFGLSYWDSAILAAAQAMGCEIVLSEDMSFEQDYDGIRVVNPFNASSVES